MDQKTYNRDVDQLRRNLGLSLIGNVLMIGALVLVLLYQLMNIGRERTVVVPGGLSKSYWLTDKTMGKTGVEELSAWVASLKLDLSPESIEYKNAAVLRHTHPVYAGEIKTKGELQADKIKKENIATTFALQTMVVNEEKIAALVRGRLATTVNGKPVSNEDKSYFLRFAVSGGTAQLMIFKEVTHGDIGKAIQEFPI
jgi:conjugal transfer pilus assembly protein TraE